MTGAYRHFFNFIFDDDHPVESVLELGSRDALDAIRLADKFGCEVISWECNPEAIELCKKHIGDREDVLLVEKAVWSESGELDFHPVVNGNLGASSCFKANHDYPYEKPYEQVEITVEAKRVDEWFEENDKPTPTLLCMDLQGAEIEALKSMGDMLHEIDYIITEGQWQRLYHNTPLIEDIAEHLKPYGFEQVGHRKVNDWFGDFMFRRVYPPMNVENQ
jgi:FkbM family methyltransferase